jgi:chloride channel protein, CIC family
MFTLSRNSTAPSPEVLAVVDSPASRRVLGLLSEAHALRRYLGELELRRRELVDEG